ncbi:MAG: hypothetical protein EZS28_035408 [Streblomastix strix]|uniref:Uncharacterized protein n=1 Tax=Streblomastix strix TaxID=222440 RepID=A0A5J4UHN7_9EUKA|nr:MAG: hypothetical protein EZS28_035408 [Streblomastix strix]
MITDKDEIEISDTTDNNINNNKQDTDYQQEEDESDEEDERELIGRKMKLSRELNSIISDKQAHERFEQSRAQSALKRIKFNPALEHQDREHLRGLRAINKPLIVNSVTGIEVVSAGLAESIQEMNQNITSSPQKRGKNLLCLHQSQAIQRLTQAQLPDRIPPLLRRRSPLSCERLIYLFHMRPIKYENDFKQQQQQRIISTEQ